MFSVAVGFDYKATVSTKAFLKAVAESPVKYYEVLSKILSGKELSERY
jgi:hypothetical protein